MQDNQTVYSSINKRDDVRYPVLVPNLKGLESAVSILEKDVHTSLFNFFVLV